MLNKKNFDLRGFELRIIKGFKSFPGGKAGPRKGVWIRGHLLSYGEDFVYHMFQVWREFCKVAILEFKAAIESGDYTAFKTYVWLLKKYDLIIPTRRERAKSTKRRFYRQYYGVNIGRLRDPIWLNPFAEYPSWQYQRKKGFPKKKKVGLRKRGRPPLYFKSE